MEFNAGFPSKFARFMPFSRPLGGKLAPFPYKLQNTLKNTSRFSASPTFKTHFWTKSLEVDFFTQMAPFSTPTAEAGPGAEKGLPEAKNRPFHR